MSRTAFLLSLLLTGGCGGADASVWPEGSAGASPVTSAAAGATERSVAPGGGGARAIVDAVAGGGAEPEAVGGAEPEAVGGAEPEAVGGTAGGTVDVPQAGAASAGSPAGGPGEFASSGAAGAPAACECKSGPCCDGCHALPKTHLCESRAVHTAQCSGGVSHTIARQYGDLYCNGTEIESCTLWVDTVGVVSTCPSNEVCHNPLNGTPYCGPL